MKIAMFVNSMGSGGAERVAATLANAWVERGCQVKLIATYTGRGPVFYTLSHNVEFVHLADIVKTTGKGPISYIKRFLVIRRIIKNENVDIVVSFLTNVNIAVLIASMGVRTPVVVCEHSNPIADGRARIWNWLSRTFYPRASVVTVLTEGVVAPFKKIIGNSVTIKVAPNPLPAGLPDTRNPENAGDGVKKVIAVGRLQPVKRLDMLIRSFKKVVEEFPHSELTIVGEGPERERLESLIAQIGLERHVFLPGTTTDPWSVMRHATAYALTSKFEGLPMAMMEGMALGIPVVAMDCPSGPRELTENGTVGMLVSDDSEESFAKSLIEVLKHPQLREEMGQRGARSVRRRYSIDSVIEIWDQIFNMAIETHRK